MTKAMPPPALNALPRNVRKLMTMLQFKRPAGSRSEALFNQRYIRSMGARPDAHGNHWLVIPGNDEIMFSSHTDTVHKTPGTQSLMYGAGALSAKDSNCVSGAGGPEPFPSLSLDAIGENGVPPRGRGFYNKAP